MKQSKANIMLAMAIVLSLSLPQKDYAQTDNRMLWHIGAGIEKQLPWNISAGLETELRLCPEKNTQNILITPQIEYSPAKFLSLGLEYRGEMEHQKDEDSQWTGRLGAHIKAKAQPGNLRLETRLKYCNYSEDWDDGSHLQYLRTRLQVGYRIKPLKLTPYVSYEWFYNLSRELVDKDRYTVGAKKKFSKHHSMYLEYMLEEKFNRGIHKMDINKHIIAVGYQYTTPAKNKKSDPDKPLNKKE